MALGAALAAGQPATGTASGGGGGFTDITQESGVAAIVQQRYEAQPKWLFFGVELNDLDGDGHLDLFMGTHSGGGGTAALGDGKGHFAAPKGTAPPTEIYMAGDIDEDGKIDLCMVHNDGGAKWWRNNSTAGELKFEGTDQIGWGGQCRGNSIIDINRDGKADWVIASAPGIQFGLGDGKGHFAKGKSLAIPGTSGQGETCVAPIDIDGDGKIELFIEWGHYSDHRGNIRLYREQADGNWVDIAEECGLPAKGISIKAFGDLNQDGSTDLLVLQEDHNLAVYFNDGKGHFTKKDNAIDKPGTSSQYLSWGLGVVTDFDNDGKADVLVGARNFLRLLRGNGDGTFTVMNKTWNVSTAAYADAGMCFGDINEDGMLDVAGYASLDPMKAGVYRNDLPKQNYLRVRPAGLPGNKGAAGAKIRVAEPGTGRLLWYEQVAIFGRQQNQTYYGLGQTERHFGLGKRDAVDVSVEFYPSGKKVEQKGVKANSTVVIEEK